MSENQPPREEGDAPCPPAATYAPVVVAHGLTYRDLQRAVFMGFGLYLLLHFAQPLTTLLLFFLLVFILSAVMNPVVSWLQCRGVPRIASALGLVVLVLGLLAGVGYLAVPPLLDELGGLVKNLSQPGRLEQYYQEVLRRAPWLQDQVPDPSGLLQNVGQYLTGIFRQVGRYTLNVFAGIFSFLILLVLVIYTTAHPRPLIAGLLAAVPQRHRDQWDRSLRRILEQLKNWAFGSLVLGVIVGILTGLGLAALEAITRRDIPYILLFSVIAAIGELIPNIGPLLSAAPPILIALTIDPMLALWIAVLFLLIQQAENNLIVPFVMGQSLDLHPVSLIFTVLVMGALFGLLGAVLAVPVCAITKVLWQEFYLAPRNTDPESFHAIADDIVMESARPGHRGEAPGKDDSHSGDQRADSGRSTEDIHRRDAERAENRSE